MKRFIIGSLMALTIGTSAFAGIHYYEGYRNEAGRGHHHHYRRENCRINPDNERMRILMAEKRLEIRKELLNEKPDWNKIEKLNTEIAVKKSQCITENMKYRFENQQDRMERIRRNAPQPPLPPKM
ncbi:MAG: hypothetical protein ACLTQH_01975 [Fusobacterium sp.]